MRRRQIFAQMAEAARAAFFTPVVQESPEATGHVDVEVTHLCECGKSFSTAQGLKIHKGRAHK